jgi:hypothetical protein
MPLNLEPFEQRLDENRPFFYRELIYSTLVTYFIPEELVDTSTPNVAADEEVTNYTSSVDLINAKSIRRTEGNLGIGFLNAITEKNICNNRKYCY